MLLCSLLGASALITVLGGWIAYRSAGYGHGDYLPFYILFPVSGWCMQLAGGLGWVGIVLAAIQFPTYAVIAWMLLRTGRMKWLALLPTLHGAVAVALFAWI